MRTARKVTSVQAELTTRQLLALQMEVSGDCTWFLSGHTHADNETINQLRTLNNVKLISLLKPDFGWFRYLPIPKPTFFLFETLSETGFDILRPVLFNFSIFEIIVCNNRFREAFVSEANQAASLQIWQSLVQDDSLFIYGLDTDNDESQTGFLEVVECRKNTAPFLKGFCQTIRGSLAGIVDGN